MIKLDILAFGAHPDDVELGCAGTLLSSAMEGKKTGIVDFTKGELGSRGNATSRLEESENSRLILRTLVRENLDMGDGFFTDDKENLLKIATCIRRYRPEIVLCNAPADRHPDHARASRMVEQASFLAGLRKIVLQDGDVSLESWKPTYVFHYLQDRFLEPDFLIDISSFFNKKMEAIACYKTQFLAEKNDSEPQTYISTPEFWHSVESRAALLGKRIGVDYAEGFLSEKIIGLSSFAPIIKHRT